MLKSEKTIKNFQINKASKRIGAAKKEMKGFNLTQEEFDAIPIDDFYNFEK